MIDAETSDVEVETAYHEAGHVVMGCVVGRYPVSVTIVRNGPVAGKTDFEPGVPSFARGHFNDSPQRRAYAEQRVLGELAGSIAHDLFKPGRTRDKADEVDLHYTRELIIELVSWQDREEYLEQAQAKAKKLLEDNWQWVAAVARALCQRKTLSRDDLLPLRPN